MTRSPETNANSPAAMDSRSIASILQSGIEIVDDLHKKLAALDELLLTGRPAQITEAAMAIELSLKHTKPAFSDIVYAMRELGAPNLEAAVREWRRIDDQEIAGLAEALRRALGRFATRSVSASRRARQLNHGLNAAMRSLHSFGLEESGRLIAEA